MGRCVAAQLPVPQRPVGTKAVQEQGAAWAGPAAANPRTLSARIVRSHDPDAGVASGVPIGSAGQEFFIKLPMRHETSRPGNKPRRAFLKEENAPKNEGSSRTPAGLPCQRPMT